MNTQFEKVTFEKVTREFNLLEEASGYKYAISELDVELIVTKTDERWNNYAIVSYFEDGTPVALKLGQHDYGKRLLTRALAVEDAHGRLWSNIDRLDDALKIASGKAAELVNAYDKLPF